MQHVAIKNIKPNPRNPRTIRDERFEKLKKSIADFPEMLEKRPLVCFTDVDSKLVVLGGNMRLKAAQAVGLQTLPVLLADDWTEEQKNEFLIKDNVGFGEWEWEALQADWDVEQLEDWGLDVPKFDLEPDYEDLIGEDKNKPATLKITFESPEQLQKAEIDIQELIDRKYQGAYFSVSAGEI
jgi:ParB-like chromosome segregation protein Spo0J